LTALLTEEKERIDLKSQRLAALEARIAATPEELGLREELVRAYFWNGYRAKAAAALEDILAARFVLSLDASDTEGKTLLSAEVLGAALAAEADHHSASLAASLRVAAGAAQGSAKAAADLAAWRKTADAASQAGKPEPAGGDTLAAASVSADEAWATSLAALSDELARAAALTDAVASLKKAADSATAADETARTSFKTLSTPSKWRFDTASAHASLQDSAGRGESMARLGMARLYLASGDYKSASGALGGIGADALRSRRAALTVELTARQGGQDLLALVQKSGDELSLAPAGAELSAALGGIESATAAHNLPAAPASDAALPERESYRAALSQLFESLSHDADAAKASALESRTQSLAVAQTLARRSDERVERAWYGFESDSLDRISELGSYYDGLGRSAAAIAEYRRVLSIDPSNLQAMFQLALAADKIGDWAVAAPLLWKVNAADPYFGNAAARYNVIARQHAETYEADAQSFADLNYLEYRARASVEYPFTSLLSIKPSFTAELLRDRYLDQYTPSPAFLVEEAAIAAPTTLVRDSSRSLILTPHVSLLGTSTQYIPTSQSPLSPSEFVRTLSGFTAAGIDADWKAGAWQGQATYSYAPLPYSLNPVLEPLYTHKVELSGGGYLPLGAPFRYFAPRVYLSGSYVPDDMNNMFGTALLELIPALRLSDSPWANLGFPVDLIYEGSTISRTSPYYAADQALTAKGGLLWQSTFTTQSGQALSLSLQAQGGLYEDALLSSSPNSYPDASLFFRLDWIREFVTYWVSVELTGANPFAANPDYWSLSIMGGVSARQPKLISP
ncbi:MAG TPA: hypothetical protein VMC79_04020, partial [Rectinemataceae bacterium]|nr:hypothetical protein [Rectinemataceae bacterium]